MAFEELECGNNIVDVAIANREPTLVMFAVLQQASILVFQWQLKAFPIPPPALIASLKNGIPTAKGVRDTSPPFWRQIVFSDTSDLFVLGEDLGESLLCHLRLEDQTLRPQDTFSKLSARELLSFPSVKPHSSYIVSKNGALAHVNDCLPERQSSSERKLPKESDVVWVTLLDKYNETFQENPSRSSPAQVIFALTKNGFLYANDRCLANDCSSFVVTGAHLLFTTSQHLLKLVHLAKSEGR